MLKLLIFYFIWIICGFVAFGFTTAYYSRDSRVMEYNLKIYLEDLFFALFGGMFALCFDYYKLGRGAYGWTINPWRKIKLQEVEDKLDRLSDGDRAARRLKEYA